jgi:DNA-binding XRE family transcriptional regulator
MSNQSTIPDIVDVQVFRSEDRDFAIIDLHTLRAVAAAAGVESLRNATSMGTQIMTLVLAHRDIKPDALPALPTADAQGRVPAAEYARASIARELIDRRIRAGLSQQQLAERSGVRQETISRLETGKHAASARTIEKLDKALPAMGTTVGDLEQSLRERKRTTVKRT